MAARWASSARADATLADQAASAASSAAATAGQAAAAAEKIRSIAYNVAQSFGTFENSIAERLAQVTDITKRYEEAKRIAEAEAERKRQELNARALEIIGGALSCEISSTNLLCIQFRQKVNEKILQGLNAAGNYVDDYIKCAGGDEQACRQWMDKTKKIAEFSLEALKGFGEAAISPVVAAWEIGGCLGEGVQGSWAKCQKMIDGVVYTLENPYTWINLDEWETNPGRALGGTLFDIAAGIATIETGGVGGAAWKSIRTVARKLDGGAGKISRGLAELESLAVKLHVSVRDKLPNGLAEILNLRAKFEAGVAKFDGGIAVVDGQLYRLEPFSVRPDGTPDLVDGATVRLEAGSLKIENGMAKLDEPKLKAEPPKSCVAGVSARTAMAAAGCGSSQPKTNPDGSYEHNDGKLQIRLTPEQNKWANDQLTKADRVEGDITPEIEGAATRTGGERYGDPDHVTKSPESFKRKLFEELQGGKTLAEVAPKMNDSVRYTISYPTTGYASNVLKAFADLERKFELVTVKNFWKRNASPEGVGGYPGINATFRGPEGVLFEVQFHTPEGLSAKALETTNYESRRSNRAAQKAIEEDASLTPEQKKQKLTALREEQQKLEGIAEEIWGDVPRPVGAILIDEKG